MIDSKFRNIVVRTDTPLPLSVVDVGVRKEPKDFHLTCEREDFELKKGLMCFLTILSVDKAAVKVTDLTLCVYVCECVCARACMHVCVPSSLSPFKNYELSVMELCMIYA